MTNIKQIDDAQFDTYLKQWAPKINKIAYHSYVPFYDFNDRRQEVLFVLWKCASGFQPERASFMTYFHRAAYNLLGKKRSRVERRYLHVFDDAVDKVCHLIGKKDPVNLVDPIIIYFGEISEADSALGKQRKVGAAIVEDFDDPYDSAEHRLSELGLTELEIVWVINCKVGGKFLSTIATALGLDEIEFKKARVSAKRKLERIKDNYSREEIING